jgi:replicative DNA helicase
VIMKIEKLILKNLLGNDTYIRKVLPFLKEEYFSNNDERVLFKTVNDFILKYNQYPTQDALVVEIESLPIHDDSLKNIKTLLAEITTSKEETSLDWLTENTEKFCQEKAIYNAIMHTINILNGDDKKQNKGAIPQLLSDALSVSFDPNIGHDYLEDFSDRYETYHRVEEKIPFDLDYFNRITKNGLPRKTLNIFLASTGVGKSLFMCHMAASCLNQGKNVLYITLELAEVEVAKRIDANLLNITMDNLLALPKDTYEKRVSSLKIKTNGKLIVKEYPTASASAIHFKSLLNELYLKKTFRPDIIFIDYINICTSSRIRAGSQHNSYTLIKSIAEELRGLAVEYDVPIVSATQANRNGYNNSDIGLEDTSESFGLPATADFMVALISTEELEKLNQIMVKQLKNRYASIEVNKRFVLGIDRSKMKLYDTEDSSQVDIIDSGQVPVMKNKFKSLKV